MDIKSIYNEVLANRRFLLYYNGLQNNWNCIVNNDAEELLNIIFGELNLSQKYNENKLFFRQIKKYFVGENEKSRLLHILSMYLLGLYVYSECSEIKKHIIEEIAHYKLLHNENIEDKFTYIWFLICFFHDFGYFYENGDDKINKCVLPRRKSDHIPDVFSRQLIKKYSDYRENKDHGISGGHKAYELLNNIMSSKIKSFNLSKEQCENNGCDYCQCNRSGICWSPYLQEIFSDVAWIVICHNIWFKRIDDVEDRLEYEYYGLNDLLLKKGEYKIDLNKSPLFYLFCLVDSIDPIKVVKDTELLDKIDIEINDKEITINSSLKCGCKDIYYKNIRQLNQWLTKTQETRAGINISI